ncbi:MAG: transketolase [Chitinophagales bacterium]|nr:transketolase [Chitinophagales bacterium]
MEKEATRDEISENLTLEEFRKEILNDYKIACESREASLLGRKEVLTGKAKFGIFGDGKELAQIAMAKAFKNGDIRSGYYRDQTFMFAIGQANVKQFFAQLYADTDPDHDPFSSGRQMNAHFSTPFIDENGEWLDLTELKNSSADTSPTASQMTRALGLAVASKAYRQNPDINNGKFSKNGNEVAFATIGDASTSEGIFWEAVNAAAVMQVPLAVSVWDDGYGISVPIDYQTTKKSISKALKGFKLDDDGGMDMYVVRGWDYGGLVEVYQKAINKIRKTHTPALIHVIEVTQPQGHSTSGSHERYKSKERLQWEKDFDCISKFRSWIIQNKLATADELDTLREETKASVKQAKTDAWNDYLEPIKAEKSRAISLMTAISANSSNKSFIESTVNKLNTNSEPIRKDILKSVKEVLRLTRLEDSAERNALINWMNSYKSESQLKYSSHLYSHSRFSAMKVTEVPAEYDDSTTEVNGFEILNSCFKENLKKHPQILAFGEDLGKIGDVNQGFAGLQEVFGEQRVFDTGIREATIIGQGIGMAMRGLRPIAEIQYLDYLVFGLQPLVDDLATLHYRTRGTQKAPLIVRTRGHRLEGIWHTGSPIAMIINALKGIYVLVPRNMTQAAGFYNTMLQSDDPALIIECLNGYRLKEKLPNNIAEFTVPLGVPETLQEGDDITLVSYGSTLRIADLAIQQLNEVGISVELIDVQTLIPFDVDDTIVESLKKTNRIAFLDEDVPGGATAYMMRQVMEIQNGYHYLDSKPITITAKPHRAAYGSDGDYFSKPNAEDVFEAIYRLMSESDPEKYPEIY